MYATQVTMVTMTPPVKTATTVKQLVSYTLMWYQESHLLGGAKNPNFGHLAPGIHFYFI